MICAAGYRCKIIFDELANYLTYNSQAPIRRKRFVEEEHGLQQVQRHVRRVHKGDSALRLEAQSVLNAVPAMLATLPQSLYVPLELSRDVLKQAVCLAQVGTLLIPRDDRTVLWQGRVGMPRQRQNTSARLADGRRAVRQNAQNVCKAHTRPVAQV